ncbi:type II secretion system protein GspD [Candidatus Rhabdochlamydia porcellionis]|jgi:general secretion pathway protein D|uniref:Type 3 secretion system secretin n=1 Tax=Candidatus Rhabdochlamydia porcellionis TaxID=225148 RepID=A0ABX8Z2B3_9BACT|nr:type II secretion system protein GspD [Candidatus Rhabdochlamydia porcellionis]QZA58181.1 Type 3 secretion system secretin [Candidatus Rhabdochlamydia porcellionis]
MKNILLYFCLATTTLSGQTLSDKLLQEENRSSAKTDVLLKEINERIYLLRSQLQEGYRQVQTLYDTKADEEQFHALLAEVNAMKQKLQSQEKQWREIVIKESKQEEEGYALWDQEETTLAHLIIEYGALDYLYIVPPEMANMKLNMHSNVPIPRESWNDVLEIILSHNGIGIKNINSYARQLYLLKQEPACIERIASSLEQLLLTPEHSRIFYVFSPPIEHIKSVKQFFEKFSDPKQTFIYQIGPKIGIVSNREEVQKILHLYQSVWGQMQGRVSRVIPVLKMSVKEMEKILQSFFSESIEKARPHFTKKEQEGLTVFSLLQGNSLVAIGRKEVVDKAERVVRETEDQLQNPAEMTVYLYPCRHSSPNDLAQVLEKVYTSLLAASSDTKKEAELNYSAPGTPFKTPPDGYPPVPPLVVAPKPIHSNTLSTVGIDYGSDHFIPDSKTGTLLMVVRRDALGKIKDLIRNLDIPKKMVQIEVLLFEKQLNCENSLGMNLLKLGSKNVLKWSSNVAPSGSGVLEFLLHNNSSKHFPAYDLAYSFLMSQDDIQLNAAPSIITVNQTPATISIVEEISINNGAAPLDTNKGTAFEKSFSRAQYGIVITLVPTIHLPFIDEIDMEETGFVTLKTNVTFDTTRHDEHKDRPLVNRRHIENEVCIADGQTVILGGLRRKASQDKEEKIPFLGDIPGLGKLFGATKLRSNDTEMFIFITPKIILDAKEQLQQILYEELRKRPGDQPEFLDCLVEAQEKARYKKIQNGLSCLAEK